MIFRDNKGILGTTKTMPNLNEGNYESIIQRIIYLRDQKTDWGFRDFLEVTYELDDDTTKQTKKENIMISQAKNSKCFNFLNDVYKGDIPDEINIEELIGKKCVLAIKHNADDKGNVYANIVERKFY
ncbi:hypothetical protein H8S20_07165 [Clostridium sp. NSJ-6]|uniref:Restriction endonuclease n=1 Tax=Clostridium hominis TaxID=2763036 RepID=A0ABR7DB99_9CLOT|nr:hypothetical protein [Clostridium hominis]MBC5628666.1 hypothetical protein [Clostridium hominis]